MSYFLNLLESFSELRVRVNLATGCLSHEASSDRQPVAPKLGATGTCRTKRQALLGATGSRNIFFKPSTSPTAGTPSLSPQRVTFSDSLMDENIQIAALSSPNGTIPLYHAASLLSSPPTYFEEYIRDSHKVMRWNDSAGEEAFNAAKRRYWAKIKGLPFKIPLPSPDEYIDQVKWNVPNCSSSSSSSSSSNVIDDAEVLDGLDEAARVEREQEEENHVLQKSSFEVSFHQIKPTGWDDDYIGHDRRYHSLTGMMVGE